MSVAPEANAPAAFDLKSAALTLIALVLKTADLAALAQALIERFGDGSPFEQEPVAIDLSPLRESDADIHFETLIALLRQHKMVPIAAKGGSERQMQAALAAGLTEAPEGVSAPAAPVPTLKDEVPPPEVLPAPLPPSAPSTMVVDRPLRSGQQVYARGADLVVLGVVNFGAEVIADGSIHVYAPLRGRAIAGARGNTEARIFATCMEPQLVSIAGIYRTTDTALPADVQGKAAQVRLDGEKLLVEPLKL
jgi:septum site-determining protein MinC